MCYQHIYIIVFLRKKQQKQVDRDSCIKYKLMLAYLIVTVSFMHFNTGEIKWGLQILIHKGSTIELINQLFW